MDDESCTHTILIFVRLAACWPILLGIRSRTKNEATLKKTFVSCTVGGRNYGQSGGRKIFFFPVFFFFFGGGGGGKKIVNIILKKRKIVENEKKKRSQSALIDSPGRWTRNNIFF